MRIVRKLLWIVPAMLLLTSCNDYDDFGFVGNTVDIEFCTGPMDLGYAIQLVSPDTLGGRYTCDDGTVYDHVVVVYASSKALKKGQHVEGRMYIDNNFSTAYCNYNYRNARGDVPEGVFTQIDKVSDND